MIQDGSHWYLQDIPPKCRRIHFFSSAHGTFSRIDHILGHKSNPNKFKKIEIVPSILFDHNAMRLDKKKKTKKIGLKMKMISDKEGQYIMIKGSIQEEGITIVNIYASNIGAPQCLRQTLTDIKGKKIVTQ